eukprot:TRINITY_DN8919_c0_g1_i1.p1 TRINITY_DN8919_c0_g1~~TRINITY_DN8919_c0_g1_i1.p1  ORF type:complete len:108 (-),score=22.32 TRINITY_DN8919_c0_g1_i1:383-706(-)
MSVGRLIRLEGETSASVVPLEMKGTERVSDLSSRILTTCGLEEGTFTMSHEEEPLPDTSMLIGDHSFKDGDEVVVKIDKATIARRKLEEMGFAATLEGSYTSSPSLG